MGCLLANGRQPDSSFTDFTIDILSPNERKHRIKQDSRSPRFGFRETLEHFVRIDYPMWIARRGYRCEISFAHGQIQSMAIYFMLVYTCAMIWCGFSLVV